MHKGTIKQVSGSTGYGFLLVEGREKDLFFHVSGFKYPEDFRTLFTGRELSFDEIRQNEKGDFAYGIELS